MSKHTPTPWRESRGFISSDANGYVPLITPFREDAHREMHGNPTPEAQANAEFIVRACNSHDDLLKACESARATIKALCEELGARETPERNLVGELIRNTNGTLEQLDAAIAKASLPQGESN